MVQGNRHTRPSELSLRSIPHEDYLLVLCAGGAAELLCADRVRDVTVYLDHAEAREQIELEHRRFSRSCSEETKCEIIEERTEAAKSLLRTRYKPAVRAIADYLEKANGIVLGSDIKKLYLTSLPDASVIPPS